MEVGNRNLHLRTQEEVELGKSTCEIFPATLRTIGPDANGAFRSYLLDYNVISLVHPHPNSDGYYPGLANSWAVGKDGRTVYFRLDPDAQYSDGKK